MREETSIVDTGGRSREWRKNNPEKARLSTYRWRANNLEKHKAMQKAWRVKNIDRVRFLRDRWRKQNIEKSLRQEAASRERRRPKINKTNAIYRKNNPLMTRWNAIVASSVRRGIQVLVTRDEFLKWHAAQEQKCAYCDLTDLSLDANFSNGFKPTMFTIDRRNSNLPYVFFNMSLACWRCNNNKKSLFTGEEWRAVAQTYIKPRWQKVVEVLSAA